MSSDVPFSEGYKSSGKGGKHAAVMSLVRQVVVSLSAWRVWPDGSTTQNWNDLKNKPMGCFPTLPKPHGLKKKSQVTFLI